VFVEFRRWKPHCPEHTRRNTGPSICADTSKRFGHSLHQSAWHARSLQLIDPVLRILFTKASRDRRHHSIAMHHAPGIRSQRVVIGEIAKTERIGARAPLQVAADSNHERPVRRLE
jgi:hypothetical protein